jgi:hypothetical protein
MRPLILETFFLILDEEKQNAPTASLDGREFEENRSQNYESGASRSGAL